MKRRFAIRTLRNQIMIGFLLVISIVLAVNSLITYRSSSSLLTANSERHMIWTANQANGRMEALIHQINTLTLQIVMDPAIQRLLFNESNGDEATFKQRQDLSGVINAAQAYSTILASVELYATDYKRIYPLDDRTLDQRLDKEWIEAADLGRGRITWLGIDSSDPDSVLAIRRISLIDRWFSGGGYLVVKVSRDYFRFRDPDFLGQRDGIMVMLDQDGQIITATLPRDTAIDQIDLNAAESKSITIGEVEYMVVKQQSLVTGWTMVMLTPLHTITEGISVLRNAVLISGAIGCLLFLVMSWMLSTLILRPVRHLITTMRSARLGKLKQNPKQYSNREMNELNHTYNEMVKEMEQLILLVYEKEIMQSRIELKALQAQINPHFLFNTLEAFYWSLEEKNETELANYVIAMSDLFRYTISQPQKEEWVTIKDELDHIERYLAIIQMRLGDRIAWQIDADPFTGPIIIPKLLIQPIVENAVQHGIENKLGAGRVTVRVLQDHTASCTKVWIEDDGVGMEAATLSHIEQSLGTGRLPSEKGSGFALVNVHRRLQLLCSDADAAFEFKIESRPNEGTMVYFTIPVQEGGNRHAS